MLITYITFSTPGALPSTSKLSGSTWIIGSGSGTDIFSIAATGVALRHAKITIRPDSLLVEDLNSPNGTFVNGARIHSATEAMYPVMLRVGDADIKLESPVPATPVDQNTEIASPTQLNEGDHQPILQTKHSEISGRIVPAHARPNSASDFEATECAAAQQIDDRTIAFSFTAGDLPIEDNVPVQMEYSLKSQIARGGMGEIFKALDSRLEREVAIKVSTVPDRAGDTMFLKEARVLANLAHPNIVPVHHIGADTHGRPFYSMKLVNGRTLQAVIKLLAAGDGDTVATFTRQRLLEIFRKVCDAVSFAHAKGYLHRDLKPENIMLGEFGEVLVMDWGLAKVIRRFRHGSTDPTAEAQATPEADTLPYIEGTPQYMSPEQANGVYGGLDERSDIYSLGGILYATLCLRSPVEGGSITGVLAKVRTGEIGAMIAGNRIHAYRKRGVPKAIDATMPAALRAVTRKAMALNPEERYGSVHALVADIEAYQGGFATSAESATSLQLAFLFIKRHRAASVLAAMLIIVALVFTFRLVASEKRAVSIAQIAEANARKAEAEREAARQSAANANIARAEAYEERYNAEEMEDALALVPPEVRSQQWSYMNHLLDTSGTTIPAPANGNWVACVGHPQKAGLFVTVQEDRWLRTIDVGTGKVETLFKFGKQYEWRTLALSPDARRLALARSARNKKNVEVTVVDVYRLPGGEELCSFDTPSVRDSWLRFNSEGALLLKVARRGWVADSGLVMMDVDKGAILWKRNDIDRSYDAVFDDVNNSVYHASLTHGLQELEAHSGVLRNSIYTLRSDAYPPLFYGKTLFLHAAEAVQRIDENGNVLYGAQFLAKSRIRSDALRDDFHFLSASDLLVKFTKVAEKSAVLEIRDLARGDALVSVPVLFDRNQGDEWITANNPLSNQVAVLRGNIMKVWNFSRIKAAATGDPLANRQSAWAFCGEKMKILQVSGIRKASNGKMSSPIDVSELTFPDLTKSKQPLEEIPDTYGVLYVCSSRDGKHVAVSSLERERTAFLKLYKADQNAIVEQKRTDKFRAGYGHFAISPDGSHLWNGGSFYDVWNDRVRPVQNPQKIQLIEDSRDVWTDNSHLVGIGLVKTKEDKKVTSERGLVLFNALLGTVERWVPASNSTALAASPDGLSLAEGGTDMKVRIRDANSLEVIRTLRVHDGPVVDLNWHPALPYLATVGEDFRARIWNLETEELVEELGILEQMPTGLSWSPDGQTLLIRSDRKSFFFRPKSCVSM